MNATEKRMTEVVARMDATKREARTWSRMVDDALDVTDKLRFARQLVLTLEEHERLSLEARALFVTIRSTS